MKCFVCGKEGKYKFCEYHNPKYGDIVLNNDYALFVGSFPVVKVLLHWIKRKKIIKWWLGTDALEMRITPPGKPKLRRILHVIKMNLLNPFITEHWLVNRHLRKDVKLKDYKVVTHPPDRFDKVEKKKHSTFIVGYYQPNDSIFCRWKYGIDIVEELKRKHPEFVYIKLGAIIDDKVFSLLDTYIRPSRHDGTPRINLRCKVEDIPFKYSSDFKPELKDFEDWLNEQYKLKGNTNI